MGSLPNIVDPRITQFRDDATDYCMFIDGLPSRRPANFFQTLLRLLSAIAKSGEAIPFDMPDRDHDDEVRINHDHWEDIASRIGEAVGPACNTLLNEVDGDEEAVTRAVMLWDDLADIYRDLREGLDLFARGEADYIAEALWQWRFNYEHHWGPHLFRAIQTVHEIRYRLHEK